MNESISINLNVNVMASLTHLKTAWKNRTGFGRFLARFPCINILCILLSAGIWYFFILLALSRFRIDTRKCTKIS